LLFDDVMHRTSLLLLCLPATVLAAACGDTHEHDAVILPSLTPCTGLGSEMCLQVAEDGGAPSVFYDGIEGFTFQWGTEATVRYSVEEIDDPPQDGSSLRYRLEQTINTELDDPGTRYELTFPARNAADDWFAPLSSSGAITAVDMLGTRVACEQAVCEQLLAGSETASTRVTLELTSTPLEPLRVVAVVR
jgi:hypothetical protein